MNKYSENNRKILANSLFQLCSQQSTGTLFILTDDNVSAQFLLEDSVITNFSFDNNSGDIALEAFKNATYNKSQFIENYQFPLTKSARIECSNSLLSELGFDEFLIDQSTERRKLLHLKHVKTDIIGNFDSGLFKQTA